MTVSSPGRAAFVGRRDAEPLGVLPLTNAANPARPVVSVSDEMVVSPQGRAALVGRALVRWAY
jgi:hypothetical protein